MINYQGRLTDSNNRPRNGSFTFQFRIYDAATSGNLIWGPESQTITVSNGVFTALVGSQNSIPLTTFNSDTRYMDVTVGGESLSPRKQILSAAYAFNAARFLGKSTDFFVSTSALNQTIAGTKTFSNHPRIEADSDSSIDTEYATKGYVDRNTDGSARAVLAATQTFTGQDSFQDVLRFSTHVFIAGNVGLGTTSHTRNLRIDSSGNADARILMTNANSGALDSDGLTIAYIPNGSDGDVYFNNKENGFLHFAASNTIHITVDPIGYVGFGDTLPDTKLDLLGGGSITVRGSGVGVRVNGYDVLTSSMVLNVQGSTQTKSGGLNIVGNVGLGTYLPDRLEAAGVMVAGNQNVGIGTREPSYALDLFGALRVRGSGYFSTTAGGNLGIGTASSASRLHVYTPAGSNGPQFSVSTGTTKFFEVTGSSLSITNLGKTVILDGNVGIGTTNPASKLDIVNGSITVRGTGAAIRVNGLSVLTEGSALLLDGSTQTKSGGLIVSGNLGVGTLDPAARLLVGGNILSVTNANVGILTLTPAYPLDIYRSIRLRGSSYFSTSSGNTGIGTTSPGAKLHVQRVAGDSGGLIRVSTGSISDFVSTDLMGVDGTNMFIAVGGTTTILNGNLGIGTANPASKFEIVNGSITVRGSNAGIQIGGYPVLTSATSLNTSASTQTKSGGLNLGLNLLGNVGLGTHTPQGKLHAFGGLHSIILDPDSPLMGRNADDTSNVFIARVPTDSEDCVDIGSGSVAIGNIANNGIHIYSGSSNVPRMVIDSKGNVGVGTAYPVSLLNVGSEDPSDKATEGGSGNTVFVGNNNANALGLAGTGTGGYIHFFFNGQNARRGYISYLYTGESGGMSLDFGVATDVYGSTATQSMMRINHSGNVGIGTLSPAAALHIHSGQSEKAMALDNSGSTTLQVGRIIFTGSGNDLTVAGGFKLGRVTYGYDGGVSGMAIGYFNTYPEGGYGSADDTILFAVGHGSFTITGHGRVGIGLINPSYRLHLNNSGVNDYWPMGAGCRLANYRNADAAKPGGGSWTDTSDIRLKKNVVTISEALKKMLSLRGVSFQWKDQESSSYRLGMIAQEVEKVFPNWVGTRPDGYKDLTIMGFEGLTVEAMREIKRKNEALKEETRQLESAIVSLEKEMGITP
ncbi:MAG: tail fiber domain-containing protein [Elusimicrobia bacterium]|nr:tail fiber domain-containing protein [Elusimicrobiota bacterium]